MEVKNVEVYGLEQSMVASGYPMLEKPMEVADFEGACSLAWGRGVAREQLDVPLADDKNITRSIKLAKSPIGAGHDNFLNGIVVQFDVDFTVKAWTEVQRYHFIDFVSSCSTMHRLKAMDLDKAYIEYVDPRVIAIMKELQAEYNANPTKENMYKMLYTNPCGLKLTARMTTNYRQLKTIYKQRCHHRLQEWQDFCQWIETLPLAKELIIDE